MVNSNGVGFNRSDKGIKKENYDRRSFMGRKKKGIGFLVSLFATAAFAVGASSNSLAGTLTNNSNSTGWTPYTVSSEVIQGGTSTNPAKVDMGKIEKNSGNRITFKPVLPAGTANAQDVNIVITPANGATFNTSSPSSFYIFDTNTSAFFGCGVGQSKTTQIVCDGASNSSTATIQSNDSLVFSTSSASSSPLSSDEWSVNVPPTDSSVDFTIAVVSKTGAQPTLDSATKTLLTSKQELSASVTSSASETIDYASDFKKLWNGSSAVATATDTIALDVSDASSSLDWGVSDAGDTSSDKLTITLNTTDMGGIKSVSGNNGLGAFTSDPAAKTFTATATSSAANLAKNPYKLTITVDGTTVLSPRTFTVDASLNFAPTNLKDETLLSKAAAGEWKYRGTTIYVPLIKSDLANGKETYIKLQSSNTTASANQVKAIVLTSDGSTVVVNLGTITAGTPLTITGKQIMDAVTAAGKSVDGANGFAATLSITANNTDLYGYANMIDPNGAKRIPLSSGKDASGISN